MLDLTLSMHLGLHADSLTTILVRTRQPTTVLSPSMQTPKGPLCMHPQDGVPSAIASLGHAGIKVWMLTGDKLETAVSISYSCSLFSTDMTLVTLREADFLEYSKAERVSTIIRLNL